MSGLRSFFLFEIGVVYLSFSMTPDVKGPAFLFYYAFLWFILLAAAQGNEWKVLLPIIIYLSAGITRFIAGQEYGMSRFGILQWALIQAEGVVAAVESGSTLEAGSAVEGAEEDVAVVEGLKKC